ncbi:MAG: hypothetical protein CL678_18920 [Bdellovibrionaceae bacterium]|nr:hypothetical protein [Pseudobdellovibrionaceae bacterium]|tara:strand:- start:371 stop:1066 length:696 start_codon:yes stop_codon:yes gene_type:complete
MSLFCCVACEKKATWKYLPLCRSCHLALKPTNSICVICGSPLCKKECRFPWLQPYPIEKVHAPFLSLGRTHEILKAWKKKPGPQLERQIFNWNHDFWTQLAVENFQSIIPVPQHLNRWNQLKHHPSHEIARRTSIKLNIPIIEPLTFNQKITNAAKKNRSERLQMNTLLKWSFSKHKLELVKKILIVDDFYTSGGTLKNISRFIQQEYPIQIQALVLGRRPLYDSSTSELA